MHQYQVHDIQGKGEERVQQFGQLAQTEEEAVPDDGSLLWTVQLVTREHVATCHVHDKGHQYHLIQYVEAVQGEDDGQGAVLVVGG